MNENIGMMAVGLLMALSLEREATEGHHPAQYCTNSYNKPHDPRRKYNTLKIVIVKNFHHEN